MALYEKRGTDRHQPARPQPPHPLPSGERVSAEATPQDLQALLAQWLAQAAPCAQCGQAAARVQAWRGSSMLVLLRGCAQHEPA